MIRRLVTAALDAGTLSRTVLVLSRQLDNAHLLAASEEARADRAELRVAELEAETRDWAELSGELAAEQPADDALPDLTDAGEAPIPIEPPFGDRIAVFTPITWPSMLNSGPPELPWLIAASVWMKSS